MKTPLAGVLPPSPLQRLKTVVTRAHKIKAQQTHIEKATQLQQQAEALARQGEHERAQALRDKAGEHEKAAEQLAEEAAKEYRVY